MQSKNSSFRDTLNWWIELFYFSNPNSVSLWELCSRQAESHEVTLENLVFRFMDDIDTKSSALLSHVSMLIAAVSILITVSETEHLKRFLYFEASVYVFVALGLLRCVHIIGARLRPIDLSQAKQLERAGIDNLSDYQATILVEAAVRLDVYHKCRNLAVLGTVLLFIGLVAKAFALV